MKTLDVMETYKVVRRYGKIIEDHSVEDERGCHRYMTILFSGKCWVFRLTNGEVVLSYSEPFIA